MDRRRAELSELSSYIRNIDNEVTLILQSFQWDRNHLLESPSLALCNYDHNHRVPPDKLRLHEEGCRLKSLGYSADELLLPDPLDVNANTLVTLSKSDIADIIDAANINPLKKARRCAEPEPMSLQRLQVAYSWEERRAIHDAVVCAAPACHDLTDLALPSGDGAEPAPKPRSRLEILAELRDMKRRRTKYRVAPKTRNYSDVLRDVISTQMEHFSEIHKETNPVSNHTKSHKCPQDNPDKTREPNFKKRDEVHIKIEPINDGNYSEERHHRKRNRSKERFEERERGKRYDDYKRRHNNDRDIYSSSSKDRSKTDYRSSDNYRTEEKDYKSNDKYRKEDKDHRSSDSYRREEKDYRSGEKYRKDDKDNRSSDGYRKEEKDYRSSEKYRKEDRDYRRDHKEDSSRKSSRTSDDTYKRERDSHKSHRDEHRRYYDYREEEFGAIRKRIKQEKD